MGNAGLTRAGATSKNGCYYCYHLSDYWRRKWQPTPVFLPRDSHGQRSLVGYRPWVRKESDTTEQLHFHFHFLTMVFVRDAAGVFPEGSLVVPGVRSRISFTSEEQWHSLGIKIRGEKCIGRLLR